VIADLKVAPVFGSGRGLKLGAGTPQRRSGLESPCKIEAPNPKVPRGRKKNTQAEASLEEVEPML
jgi:hypothetical protein